MNVTPGKPKRFLSKKVVLDRVPYSSNHLDRLEADGRFPKRVRLSPNRVVWLESEIDSFIDARVRERDEADQNSPDAARYQQSETGGSSSSPA